MAPDDPEPRRCACGCGAPLPQTARAAKRRYLSNAHRAAHHLAIKQDALRRALAMLEETEAELARLVACQRAIRAVIRTAIQRPRRTRDAGLS